MQYSETTEYAGFWMRFLALIIDMIVVNFLLYLFILPILGAVGLGFIIPVLEGMDAGYMSSGDALTMLFAAIAVLVPIVILSNVIVILYYTIMEASKYQATFGKMALGLIVTDQDGNKLDFMRSLIRQLAKMISSAICLIGYLMAGFTSKKQALHDIIAGALVIRKEL